MSRYIFLVTLFVVGAFATTMTELFDAISKQPTTKLDTFRAKMAQIAKDKIEANYYPNVEFFASYTHYNSPTNLMPLDPKELGF